MKRRVVLMVAIVAAMIWLPSSVIAQERLLFRVNVPFEFIAAGVHMPSGTYLAFHETATIIKFLRSDGRASVWIAVKASPLPSDEFTNQVVFNRYGDTYFLSKVHSGLDQQMHECFRCRSEETLAAKYSSGGMTTVALAVTQVK